MLFDDCVTGNYLKKVDIIYDKPMGDNQEDYFKIHMEDALITSIQHSGSTENPMESISFAFSKIKVSYNPEEEGALKGFIDKGFDVLKTQAVVTRGQAETRCQVTAKELFAAGKVREAEKMLTAYLREHPSDTVSAHLSV